MLVEQRFDWHNGYDSPVLLARDGKAYSWYMANWKNSGRVIGDA
jgi:hypothetical protein